jgi:hypothetical protein
MGAHPRGAYSNGFLEPLRDEPLPHLEKWFSNYDPSTAHAGFDQDDASKDDQGDADRQATGSREGWFVSDDNFSNALSRDPLARLRTRIYGGEAVHRSRANHSATRVATAPSFDKWAIDFTSSRSTARKSLFLRRS